MGDLNATAAEMLEVSASGYAAAALAAMRARAPELAEARNAGSAAELRASFTQRVLELAAALRVREPELFVRRVAWIRRALAARGAEQAELGASLEALREALEQELPAKLRESAMAPVELALASLQRPVEDEASPLDPSTLAGRLALSYLEACLAGERERAVDLVLGALGTELAAGQMYVDVLAPAQQEIGRLWHTGDAAVVEERLVSETTRELLPLIAERARPGTRSGHTVLAASVAGNAHDIGLRIIAELYRLAGWRCIFLGANLPTEELARAVQMFDVDLVLLNATLTTQLHDAARAIEAVRQGAHSVRVLVGGRAFDGAAQVWRQIGADGYAATLEEAVAAGRALVER